MRAHWKQFLALFFAIAVAITSGVIVTTRNFQAKVEMVVHEHTDECYGPSEISELVCEKEPHLHNDDCFEMDSIDEIVYAEDGSWEIVSTPTRGALICTKEVHEHDMACYQQKVDLICGKIAGQEYPVEVADQTYTVTVQYIYHDFDMENPDADEYYPVPGKSNDTFAVKEDGTLVNGDYFIGAYEDNDYWYFVADVAKDEVGDFLGTVNHTPGGYEYYGPWQGSMPTTDTISNFILWNGQPITSDLSLYISYDRLPKVPVDYVINFIDKDTNEPIIPAVTKKSYDGTPVKAEYDNEITDSNGVKYTVDETTLPGELVLSVDGENVFNIYYTKGESEEKDAKMGKLVVAIRPDGDTHNGDNYTMENGSKFFNNGNYVHPFWEEEVDFNQYFTSTDAITNTSGLANSQIVGVLTPALTGEIESRLAAGQLRPGQKLNVMLNGSYQDITFDPAIHEIIYTNLNWHGNVLHLDGVIRFKNEVDLSYDSNLPDKTSGKTLATDRSPLTGETVDFTVRDGNEIGIKSSDGKEYVFVGWNTKADGSGTPYAPGSTISVKTNTTLYAQWEEKKPEVNVIIRYIDKDKNTLKTERDAGTIKAGVDPTTLITADDTKDIEKDGRTYKNSDAGTKITEENGNTVVTLEFGLVNRVEVIWKNEGGDLIKGPEFDDHFDANKDGYKPGDTVNGTDGKTYVVKTVGDPETKENGDQTVTIECVEKVVDVTINFVDKEGNPIPGKDPVVLRDQKVGTDITESVTRESNQTIPVKKDGKDYEYKFVGVLDKEYKVQSDNNVINLEFDPEDITVYNLKVNYWKSELSGQNKLQDSRIVPINDGVLAIPEGEGVKNADGTITPSLITPAVSGYLPYKFEVRNGDFKGQDWAEVVNAVKAFDSTIVYDDVEKTFVVPAGFNPKALAIALKDIVPSQNYEVDVYYAPYTVANGGGTNSSQPGTTPEGGQPTGTQPGNTTPTPNPPQVQNNTPVQPGNVTPVQPGNTTPNQPANTTPNAQPQAETPSLINANGQTPVAPVQAEDATLNNAAIPGVTPAPEAAVADEASATSSTSYVPAATPTAVPADNVIALAMEQTPTGNVQLTQVDDIEAALADFNFGHVCNILYFLIIAGTIVVLANYFRMSKKHSKRVFELRGELGEDDPYKKN